MIKLPKKLKEEFDDINIRLVNPKEKIYSVCCSDPYLDYTFNNTDPRFNNEICLDGDFTISQLEAILDFMKEIDTDV